MTGPVPETRTSMAPEAPRTRLSLPEIDALCTKAARGAGYAWGVAEEAGFACRWLAERRLPGPDIVAAYLDQHAERPWQNIAPANGRDWRRDGDGSLCPIAAGIAFADRASDLAAMGPISARFPAVNCPVLMLPFVWRVAFVSHQTLSVEATDWKVRLGPQSLDVVGAPADPGFSGDGDVVITATPDQARQACLAEAGELSARALRILERFSQQTYVPASALSRAGAGAGESDND
ncbi:MAG: DUF3726 domain-containing protein [Rhodobacteraceae bacterium]|nr:DUF3726 domain-containing protein [Paracoccaceae bacterium]